VGSLANTISRLPLFLIRADLGAVRLADNDSVHKSWDVYFTAIESGLTEVRSRVSEMLHKHDVFS
jgi:hypothetical protein